MSISGALSNALSGLTAVSRAAEVVASNTANALTEGYARRELSLSSRSLGGTGAGVWVDGVSRVVDRVVLADRRLAAAEAENASVRRDFLAGFESLLGNPGERGSLSANVAGFEAALIEAASRPDSEARLASVLVAAERLSGQLNSLSASLLQTRTDADRSIGQQVQSLNASLAQIDRLNAEILAQRAARRDATALMDQRQRAVDTVAEIVPVREVARENEQISLYTTGGAILLEGNAAVIGFTPAGIVTPDMTLGSGALSGLSINGMAVPPGDDGLLGGGSLGATFALRDVLVPSAQTQLDAFARDLISRFESPAVDPTLAPGEPGLFTDRGNPLDPAEELGLAGRIVVNARADPARGGALWRLRDGLGATAQGAVGNSGVLTALVDALSRGQVPASGNFIGAQRSASGLAADILSQASSARQSAEAGQAFASARQDALRQLQLADGVDTDHEMQMLLQIEQAFAANARVMGTVDELIKQLLAI
ncbi:MAG: flagellar hook-associated protein FlgK [Phaeovulum sp.]|uniref:flagellar hook-associated protein FlgK n=1 Tax=Phaeovulum sp. TaxID=2934796 RepID=UPI0027344E34|nr:flagellar hook-associated protein FlgK [Phaeovulum sp.]MDP3860018.1 flagellar hook-associated protein FlgK [Phaeovulum sp.]